MMNQVMLIGKVRGVWPDKIMLEVGNEDERTTIPVYITEAIRSNMGELANEGDIVGIKGCLNGEYGNVKVVGKKLVLLN